MNSLSDLNSFGSSSLEFTDPRPATVIFSKPAPQQARDQVIEISSTSVAIPAGADILEIINYSTANVRYRVEIKTAGSPALTGSSITWNTLPTGVTSSVVGNVYTLSGINSVAAWRQIKDFTWTLPAGYASSPFFWLEVSVLYYDATLAAEQTVNWRVFDLTYYTVSQMSATSSMVTLADNFKFGQATLVGAFTPTLELRKLVRISATLTSVTSMTVEGHINADALFSTTALTAAFRYAPGNIRGNLVSTASVVCTGILLISNMHPRDYYANQENDIFFPDPPQIDDSNPATTSTFEITLNSSLGSFSSSSSVTPTSPFVYSGTLTQVNSVLASMKFYPTEGVSSNGTISYTQKKDSVTQLTRTIDLIGNAGTYTGHTYTFNASQLWNPPNEDLIYSSNADILLVGGGGGGAFSGGGGGGGLKEALAVTLTQQSYSVSVGSGGAPVAPHAVELGPLDDPSGNWWTDWQVDNSVWYVRRAGGTYNKSTATPELNQGVGIGVIAITQSTNAVVTTLTNHSLSNGDDVTFSDVTGMTELNGNTYYVNVTSPTTFRLYVDSALTTPLNTTTYKTFISDGFCFFDEQYRYVGMNPSLVLFNRYPNYYFYVSNAVTSFNPIDREEWTPLTNYSINNIVYVGAQQYLCQVSHSSQSIFSLDSDKWIPYTTSWNFSLKTSDGTAFFNPTNYTVTGASADATGTTLPLVYYDPETPYNRPYDDGYVFRNTSTSRNYVWNFQAWADSGYTTTGGWINTGVKGLGYKNATINFSPTDAEAGNYIYCDVDGTPSGGLEVEIFTAYGLKANNGGNTTAFGYTATGGAGGEDFGYGALAQGYCKGGDSGLPGLNDSTAYTGATSTMVSRGAGGAGAGGNGFSGTDYDGGVGKLSSITGQYYGGGGGGGISELVTGGSGEGGLGGGGNGADQTGHPATAGTANTGGGGGGGLQEVDNAEPITNPDYFAKAGGSGLVVVRFNA